MQIKVECYSGSRGDETPRRICIFKRKIEIIKVQDRWISPNHRYFKVLGDDDAVYTLSQDSRTWEWDLTFHSASID